MIKKNCLLMLMALMLALPVISQKVKYGESLKTKVDYSDLVGAIDGNYFLTGGTRGGYFSKSSFQMSIVDDGFNVVLTKDLEFEQDREDHVIQDIVIFNEQLYVFTSTYNKKEDVKKYYHAKLNSSTLELKGKLVEFASEEASKKRGSGYLTVDASDEKMVAFLVAPYQKNGKERFRFLSFDKDDNIKGIDVEVPYPDRAFSISSAKFSPTGELFVSGFEFEYEEGKKRRSVSNKIAHIFSINPENEKITDYDINLGDDNISDMRFELSQKGDLLIAGFYSTMNYRNVKGMFFLKVDGTTKKTSKLSKEAFSDDFIVSSYSEKKAEKVKKKADKKDKELELYSYDIDDLVLTDDGGLVLLAEQYYVYTTSYTDQNGNRRTTYHYVYNDILVMKINASGDVAWLTKVPKHQNTANDGGYYSSYAMMVNGDEINLYYNDHISNMEKDRSGEMRSFRFGKNGCITKATVYSDGVVDREVLIGEKMELYLRPKISFQLDSKDLLVYFRKKKNKQFGVIQH